MDLNLLQNESLEWNEVRFVPIRHHSPACATALRSLLEEVSPRAILIEGPREFDALLAELADDRVRCPVAVFTPSAGEGAGWFFPLCESSPEWVALRHHREQGVEAHFIDLSPACRAGAGDPPSRSLMDESRLAHSRWVQALVTETGCRDHDELWERLFELRTLDALRDWRGFFREVHLWCALGRSTWDPRALRSDGELDREACMVHEIRRHRARIDGPLVVVTGGFHTPSLLEQLRSNAKPARVPACDPGLGPSLIRYGFRELDALAGYASGMPSPAYQQGIMDGFRRGEQTPSRRVCRDMLLRMGRSLRESGATERVGTPAVESAVVHAERLAALRDLVAPGRSEWLDSAHSCFLKEARHEARGAFRQELLRMLGGSAMGDIPPSDSSPPLLEDARRQAKAARVNLEDTTRRTAHLDVHRKPAHRARERFFRLVSWLGVPLATWQGGPDLVHGTGLDLLTSQWQIAWNPLVEASLCELAKEGGSLQSVASQRLAERLVGTEAATPDCPDLLRTVQTACLLGVLDRIAGWREQVALREAEETSFAGLVESCRRLVVLRQVRHLVDFPDPVWLDDWLSRFWARSVFALDALAGHAPQGGVVERRQETESVVTGLLTLREICRESSEGRMPLDADLFRRGLERLAATSNTPGMLAGAATALLALDGRDGTLLERATTVHLGVGASEREATDFLRGILRAAPELLLREGKPLRALHERIGAWDEERFLGLLPELRQCFQMLDPARIDQLADRIHEMVPGGERPDPFAAVEVPSSQILSAARLESRLAAVLDREGLSRWLSPEGAE